MSIRRSLSNSISNRLSLRRRGSTNDSSDARSHASSSEYSAGEQVEAFLDGPAVKKKCVIGIDFGTSNSGYCYAMTSDKKIRVVRKKEATCALFRRSDKKLIEFGADARSFYRKAKAGSELLTKFSASEQTHWEDDYIFIDQDIKMRLYEENHETLMKGKDDDDITYFDMVSAILHRIKETAIDHIDKEQGVRLDPQVDILWVVTCPSIWRESDKQFMRRCATAAELIVDEFSSDLILALESECAVIWAEVVFTKANADQQGLREGQKVFCLDCGGGTVDISAIQITKRKVSDDDHATHPSGQMSELKMNQLLPPVGINVGSQNIDQRFRKFLKDFLGEENFNLCWNQPDARMELQDGWERLKCSLKAENFSTKNKLKPKMLNLENTLNELNVRLPDLVTRYNERSKKRASDRGGKARAILVEYKKNLTRPATKLIIPPALLHYCFDRTVSLIVSRAEEVFKKYLENDGGVDHLVLYGGLGNCEYLQYSIRKKFQSRMKVLTPKNASLAVMKGSVRYGMYPGIINSRRARMTVGIKVTIPFIRGKHNKQPHLKHKEYDAERREYFLRDAFKTFVIRDQLVNVNEDIKHTFAPASKNRDTIKFDVYGSMEKKVQYVTEDGCFKLAKIVVPIEKGSMRNITCALSFGYTEIRAKILDDQGNLVREVPLQYNRIGENAIISEEDDMKPDSETTDEQKD